MISFELAAEQQLRNVLARFASERLLPGYRDRAASTEFPWEIRKELGVMGVHGIGLPERFGTLASRARSVRPASAASCCR